MIILVVAETINNQKREICFFEQKKWVQSYWMGLQHPAINYFKLILSILFYWYIMLLVHDFKLHTSWLILFATTTSRTSSPITRTLDRFDKRSASASAVETAERGQGDNSRTVHHFKLPEQLDYRRLQKRPALPTLNIQTSIRNKLLKNLL